MRCQSVSPSTLVPSCLADTTPRSCYFPRLRSGHSDASEPHSQAERDSIQATLAQLPDEDRIRTFDAHRAKLLALRAAIAVASPARREELCRIVVEQVVVNDREVRQIVWTPPARPFFDEQREYPQAALGARPLSDDGDLEWYVA